MVVGSGLLVGGGNGLGGEGRGLLWVPCGGLMLKMGGGLKGCQDLCRNWGATVEDVLEVLS